MVVRKGGINVKCCNESCENLVYVKPFQIEKVINGSIKKFCSRSCSAKTIKNKKRAGELKNCLNCNKLFYAQKNQITQKCCSHKCASDYKTGKDLLLKRNGTVKKCVVCEKEFYVQKHRLDVAKYCSSKCNMNLYKWKTHKYNPLSISIIEDYGEKNGFIFQHAENGGEYQIPGTNYFVDGYDIKKNTVIEYDEKHHFYKNGNLKNKDIKRQKIIMKILNCLFIRINYKNEIKIYEQTNIII